jgi:hypothetical protein
MSAAECRIFPRARRFADVRELFSPRRNITLDVYTSHAYIQHVQTGATDMMKDFTREQDEWELELIAHLERLGIEVLIDENERPSMLAELIGPVSDRMRKTFWLMFGGAQ